MKKNSLRFIITICLLIVWLYVAFENLNLVVDPIKKYFNNYYSFKETINEIEKNYTDKLKEKRAFINLNGLYVNISGGSSCNNVIKLSNGSLTTLNPAYDTTNNAQRVIELNNKLKELGIDFLYVQYPYKTNPDLLPYGLEDETDNNVDIFLNTINEKVSYIDTRPYFTATSNQLNQYFYKTDHHWNPLGAFKAFQLISEYLQSKYPDESIYGDYQSIENWNINKKEDWFLGSWGKRTGIYFTGVDDLIWLTPKFETHMSFINAYKDEFFSGDYYTANVREEYIYKKDYYKLNAYSVYIGGDYPLVQHRNHFAPVDKKILIIKDSFTIPLQTFFSTVFSEVDVIDLRYYKAGSLYEYILESNPDIVIMCLNGKCVSEDIFFYSGITQECFTNSNNTKNQICQWNSIEIDGTIENSYNYIPIYDQIESGKKYTLICDSVGIEKGDPKAISIKLYDKNNETTYDCTIWDIDYCQNKGSFEWTFTAPSDVDNLELIVFSGIAGQTDGNSVVFNNVRLYQE